MEFKLGDIVKLTVNKKTVEISSDVNIQDYVEYIGIVNKLENGVLSFCVTMETQTGLLHFANENNKEHINFGLDKIHDANLLTIKDDIEYFYRCIFKYCTVEKRKKEPNWFDYFTDLTYDEIIKWFAYKCCVKWKNGYGYDDFVYGYTKYIWTFLIHLYFTFTEKPKDEDKMISLNKACEWILENMPKYVDSDACCLKRDVYEHLMAKDFKKAMEE